MGGTGSGYYSRWRRRSTTEEHRCIDIRWLKKKSLLQPGIIGSLHWVRNGIEYGNIDFQIKNDRMVLLYNVRQPGGEWNRVEQTVFFDKTPCHYGGHRWWFLCYRCDRRVVAIYAAGKYFLCRHCYGLTYRSRQETRYDRMLRKASPENS